MHVLEARPEIHTPTIEVIELLGKNRPKRTEVEKRPLIYLHPENETHGLLHTTNVLVLVKSLYAIHRENEIKMYGHEGIFTGANEEAVVLAALYHDSHHSGIDPDYEHGRLAADWMIGSLKGDAVQKAASLVRFHVPDDDPTTMTTLLGVLKDADGLERVRAEKGAMWELDPKYLRYNISHKFIEPLRRVNEIAKQLRKDGFPGDGVELSLTAFTSTGWLEAA